jgi:hypothetical protein
MGNTWEKEIMVEIWMQLAFFVIGLIVIGWIVKVCNED